MNILNIKNEFPAIQIKGVIHVGGHTAEEWPIYQSCKVEDLIWIEANPDLANTLHNNFKNTSNISVICAAIFDVEKTITFNITNNVCSSSLFDLKDHKSLYPGVYYNKTIEVETKRLDTLIENKQIDISKYNTLVIDVQGAELQVVKSLGNYLSNIDYILSEISIAELYEGTTTIDKFDSELKALGFTKIKQQLETSAWGDAFYIKDTLLHTI